MGNLRSTLISPIRAASTVPRMEFEWDEAKAARNLTKHQVSFNEAKLALADRNRVEFPQRRGGEDRWIACRGERGKTTSGDLHRTRIEGPHHIGQESHTE